MWRSKQSSAFSKIPVSADRLTPTLANSEASMLMQLPEAQLPDDTTRTAPNFSSLSSPISCQGPDHGREPLEPPQPMESNLSL